MRLGVFEVVFFFWAVFSQPVFLLASLTVSFIRFYQMLGQCRAFSVTAFVCFIKFSIREKDEGERETKKKKS